MAEVLEQSDIDALLKAVDAGDVEASPGEGRIFGRHNRDPGDIEVHDYDFKRPERVSKDQMRALQTLHEGFARNFGASISAFLRMIVEVRVASCEQMTYGEFIAGLPNPTSFNLIHVSPVDGQICLELSPLIIYPIIDRLLGGNNDQLFVPSRPLTAIETRLVMKIIDRAMAGLREAWEEVAELEFSLGESESNPQLVQIVPPNEVAIVIGFELKLAERSGAMNLCIPYKVIEPLMDKISSQSWFRAGDSQEAQASSERIAGQLSQAGVDVSGLLAETTITLQDLMNLSTGDLITTDKPASAPSVLCVEGEKKFLAHLGQYKGARALKIERPTRPGDRV